MTFVTSGGCLPEKKPHCPKSSLSQGPHVPLCFYWVFLRRTSGYRGDTSACINVGLHAHISLQMTVEGFHWLQHQKEATNVSGLLRWQPDHVCVYLQTDPCCWCMCGTDHPLHRYVHCSIYISVPQTASSSTKPDRKKNIWFVPIMLNKGIMLLLLLKYNPYGNDPKGTYCHSFSIKWGKEESTCLWLRLHNLLNKWCASKYSAQTHV